MPDRQQGRWPANVILSPEMAEALDEQSGNVRGGQPASRSYPFGGKDTANYGGSGNTQSTGQKFIEDNGGASRFFLEAGYEPWELEWIYANGLRPCGDQPNTPTNS